MGSLGVPRPRWAASIHVRWSPDASPEAVALVRLGEAAEAELDLRNRAALYQRIDLRSMEIGPYAPLFQSALPYAFRSDVRDVAYNGLGILDLSAISKAG